MTLPTHALAPGRRHAAIGVVVLTAVLLATGCAAPVQQVNNPIRIDQSEYDRVFDAVVLTLRDEGFTVDRNDYRFGVVTTRPRLAATAFEPWHNTSSATPDVWESTFNDRRRLVSVTIEPLRPAADDADAIGDTMPDPDVTLIRPEDNKFMLHVVATIEQLESPTQYVTGSTAESRMLAGYGKAPRELSDRGIPDRYWRSVGRDTRLEQILVANIIRRSVDLVVNPVTP